MVFAQETFLGTGSARCALIDISGRGPGSEAEGAAPGLQCCLQTHWPISLLPARVLEPET